MTKRKTGRKESNLLFIIYIINILLRLLCNLHVTTQLGTSSKLIGTSFIFTKVQGSRCPLKPITEYNKKGAQAPHSFK